MVKVGKYNEYLQEGWSPGKRTLSLPLLGSAKSLYINAIELTTEIKQAQTVLCTKCDDKLLQNMTI